MKSLRSSVETRLPTLGTLLACVAIAWLLPGVCVAEGSLEGNLWLQWRGPFGTGAAAADADPPVVWSEESNVRWKTALPGVGHSTPVVLEDRLVLTAAVSHGAVLKPAPSHIPGAHDNFPVTQRHRFVVLAVDRADGKILWQREVREALPHEGGHISGSLASASPVSDGERVFAHFGSHGLYAVGLDGEVLWRKDFGAMQTKHAHGEGSSPALHGDTVLINWDHEGASFVAALDTKTGEERWRQARDEVTSWSTPLIVEHRGKVQAVVPGSERVRGYDLASGEVLWECGGLSHNIVASPVAGHGMVFVASSYEIRAMLAIRLDGAKGDITGTENVAWSRRERTPYVPSPLLYEGDLYFLRHYQGVLSRVDARTGEERLGPFRLNGIRNIYASPVAAAGRIYVTDRQGATLVLEHSETPKVLSYNQLDDSFSASAAVVGKEMFLRGEKALYSLAVEETGAEGGAQGAGGGSGF